MNEKNIVLNNVEAAKEFVKAASECVLILMSILTELHWMPNPCLVFSAWI